MTRRADSANPLAGLPLPKQSWIVGEMEIRAPGDWTEDEVCAAMSARIMRPVRADPPRGLRARKNSRVKVAGRWWFPSVAAVWREDIPHPLFEYAPHFSLERHGVAEQTIEMFLRGRATQALAYAHRLTNTRADLHDARSFSRDDGRFAHIAHTFAPWYGLQLDQNGDERGMIRATLNGEAVAYLRPCDMRSFVQRAQEAAE